MQDILTLLSKQHLQAKDWLILARFWDFDEEHIEAIEHQYTGRCSYKDHCHRMMMIWLHSLPSNRHPMRELSSSLMAIGRGSLAKKVVNKTTTTTLFLYPDDRSSCLRFLLLSKRCHRDSCCISWQRYLLHKRAVKLWLSSFLLIRVKEMWQYDNKIWLMKMLLFPAIGIGSELVLVILLSSFLTFWRKRSEEWGEKEKMRPQIRPRGTDKM